MFRIIAFSIALSFTQVYAQSTPPSEKKNPAGGIIGTIVALGIVYGCYRQYKFREFLNNEKLCISSENICKIYRGRGVGGRKMLSKSSEKMQLMIKGPAIKFTPSQIIIESNWED